MLFYDFEVFKYDWLVVFIDPSTGEETVIVNDRERFTEFYNAHKEEIWVGFNSRFYDVYIAQAILAGFNPKDVNDWIIKKNQPGFMFSDLLGKHTIYNYDTMTGYHGLKTLESFMGNDIRESSVPFDIDRKLTVEEIQETIGYCRHDVEQTIEVFIERISEFEAQRSLIKTFGLHLSNLSKTQAQLACIILGAQRVETHDEFAIRMPDTLKLDRYRHVADWYLNPTNHDYDKALETVVADVPHTFAWGGGHGAIPKYVHVCGPDEIMVMADVDQLYPTLMVEYGLLSRAVRNPEKFKWILSMSLKLKAEGKKKEREPYKRICNISYGVMGAKDEKSGRTGPMYDPLHRNLVCIFGQVLLLDLIEKIEGFATLIQNNTDGILIKIKRADFDRLDDAVFEWEQRTRLHMSFDYFQRVYQGDVNNYLAVTYDGKVKGKGAYAKSLGRLDNDLAIVNKAIRAYIIEGTHPYDTVMSCDDLGQFQKVVKVSDKYDHGGHEENGQLARLNDRTFRVFASTRKGDGRIMKVKAGGKPEKFANTPDKCFIFNESLKGVAIPEYLDRQYYIDLAVERLKKKFNLDVTK